MCEGDSLTDGNFSTTASSVAPKDTYPSQLQALRTEALVVNEGAYGNLVSDVAGRAATIDAAFRPGGTLLLFIGTNDLAAGTTAATLRTSISTYVAARKAIGWKVFVATLLPRTATGAAAGFETQRQSFNGALRADFSFADGLMDFGADPVIGVAGAQTNTTYFQSDQVHLVAAGYAILARIPTAATGSARAMTSATIGGGGSVIKQLNVLDATLSGGSVSITDPTVTSATRILGITSQGASLTGILKATLSIGNGYTISSSQSGDSGAISYLRLN